MYSIELEGISRPFRRFFEGDEPGIVDIAVKSRRGDCYHFPMGGFVTANNVQQKRKAKVYAFSTDTVRRDPTEYGSWTIMGEGTYLYGSFDGEFVSIVVPFIVLS